MKLDDIALKISHSIHNVGDVLYNIWGSKISKRFFYQVVAKGDDGYKLRPFHTLDGGLFRKGDKNYIETLNFKLVRAPEEDYKNLTLLDAKDYEAK